ncbi:MAG: phosphate/phosphite/phosphonate ABC transporter substrate-binding protein [Desulfomonile tiedjei]|uniref:Phosphate/phosphite/phosphonate ABC transporter substrate-binding protein n=1 Tax=Desulfomonile tiedjei TaxID=2358 RepID=A0A9D6V700_9BACT|nr:phosphate/phosphite/phosphonate ABC transporter substrate-binding protein [Desulfomonile tiedjei]
MKRVVLAASILVAILVTDAAQADVKLGMLAQRGAETALREWGPLGEYLSERIGEKVTIVPLKFTEFMDFPDLEPSGFIFTNPWFYVRAKVLKNAKALVTVKYQGSGERMGGVIFVRRDSGTKSIQELRNKVLICPKLSSPGGWLFAKGEIVKSGIIPEKDFKQVLETPKESHDEVVYAVRDGKADVGTVRNNILETMQREGKINMQDFLVLNEMKHENFSDACSTPLYPDWPVASLKGTSPELAAKMKQALLAIPQGSPVLQQARRIDRFVEALDYGPMEELCRFLRVPPFRAIKE